jgi:glycosyltransferase involved in cell wall biosynthesis
MIVKNEQDNLPKCLASVEGIFDEIVVVDTGSNDRTKEIAREFGANVFDFPWIDDFAAARNEALSHATGDYAFWLDADDVVEPEQREKLVALLDGLAVPAARSPATAPRNRPSLEGTRDRSGGLSPAGRGEDEQPGDPNRHCSHEHLSPSPPRGEGRGEGQRR